MGMLDDFKKFLTRGNLMDLAIGFTVGAAFTTVAKSIVSDLLMPLIGYLIGNVDFQDFFFILRDGKTGAPYTTIARAQQDGAVTLNYGVFTNNVVALLMVGLAMFALVRFLKRAEDRLQDDDGQDDHVPDKPDDKKCRFCRSKIHYRATRCPFCTSELELAA